MGSTEALNPSLPEPVPALACLTDQSPSLWVLSGSLLIEHVAGVIFSFLLDVTLPSGSLNFSKEAILTHKRVNLGPVSWRCPDSGQVVVTLTPRLPSHAEAYPLCNFLGLSSVQIFH